MANIFKTGNVIFGTAAEFAASNPTLPDNVLAYESDSGVVKKGDGATAYTSLKNTQWAASYKTADQTVVSNNTLFNDDTLTFAMLANTKYTIRIKVHFDTTAAADFKFALTGPASPTLVRLLRKHVDPNALTALIVASETAYTSSTAVAAGTGTNGGFIEFDIIVHNGVNAGTFAFQWAQNTSDNSNTVVRAGSYIEWKQLA